MKKLLVCFFVFPCFVFADPFYLKCGEERYNHVEELNDGPEILVVVDDFAKDSQVGTSTGKVFSMYYSVWEDAEFWWTPTYLAWKKYEEGRPHKGMKDKSVERSSLKGPGSSDKCSITTKEFVEEYSQKVVNLYMESNSI